MHKKYFPKAKVLFKTNISERCSFIHKKHTFYIGGVVETNMV